MVLVERYPTLGGVCLNVGCIPSQGAAARGRGDGRGRRHFADLGVTFGEPQGRPRQAARAQGQGGRQAHRRPGRDGQDAQGRRCVHRQSASSPTRTTSTVTTARRQDADDRASSSAIIAAGSQAVKLPFLPGRPARRRLAPARCELRQRARRSMLVIGGGIIGLEMGTVYSTLGARLDVVEMLDGLMLGADRDLVKVWQKMNAPRFDKHHAEDQDRRRRGHEGRHPGHVRGRGRARRAQALRPGAAGRRPHAQWQEDRRRQGRRRSSASAASSRSTRRCAPMCRTSSPSATSSASRCWRTRRCTRRMWRPRSPPGQQGALRCARDPGVAYTDPEVAWVGLTEDEAKAQGIEGQEGPVPVDGLRPRDRQRPRRRLHQAAVRRGDAPHPRRRHRRHPRRRHDRRGRAGHRDGRRRGRHRQDHPPAPDAGRDRSAWPPRPVEGVCTDLPPQKKK